MGQLLQMKRAARQKRAALQKAGYLPARLVGAVGRANARTRQVNPVAMAAHHISQSAQRRDLIGHNLAHGVGVCTGLIRHVDDGLTHLTTQIVDFRHHLLGRSVHVLRRC